MSEADEPQQKVVRRGWVVTETGQPVVDDSLADPEGLERGPEYRIVGPMDGSAVEDAINQAVLNGWHVAQLVPLVFPPDALSGSPGVCTHAFAALLIRQR